MYYWDNPHRSVFMKNQVHEPAAESAALGAGGDGKGDHDDVADQAGYENESPVDEVASREIGEVRRGLNYRREESAATSDKITKGTCIGGWLVFRKIRPPSPPPAPICPVRRALQMHQFESRVQRDICPGKG